MTPLVSFVHTFFASFCVLHFRLASPRHGFTIMNRLNVENLTEPITKDLDFQLQHPFLLYRNARCKEYRTHKHFTLACELNTNISQCVGPFKCSFIPIAISFSVLLTVVRPTWLFQTDTSYPFTFFISHIMLNVNQNVFCSRSFSNGQKIIQVLVTLVRLCNCANISLNMPG